MNGGKNQGERFFCFYKSEEIPEPSLAMRKEMDGEKEMHSKCVRTMSLVVRTSSDYM